MVVNTPGEFPYDRTLNDFTRIHALTVTDHIAIVFEENHLTYRCLEERSRQLALYLRELGVGEDQTVGLLMERSPRMVESILAVWKNRGAYIPLEIDYPTGRILEIMKDAGTVVLLTCSRYVNPVLEAGYNGKLVKLDEERWEMVTPGEFAASGPGERAIDLNSLAYVIYTSGSTGKPKGVMIEHIGMMNHVWAKIDDLELTAQTILAQNASHTFDISVWQFFAPLVVGARVAIYPHELILEPENFISRLVRDRVNILEVVPSYLSILLDTLDNQGAVTLPLDYLLVTGEEIKSHLVKRWFERCLPVKMVNAYGPTEASDDITHHIMESAPQGERIPIGKPIQNLNISIVDENMNPCPVDVKGEICVSGIAVGRGYLNNPELTAQKFQIPNKAGYYRSNRSNRSYISKKIFKTGDLGCWLPDGTIDFFGRKDYQVKIRGFRIELGEIEKQLLDEDDIKDAVVIEREDGRGNKHLCAYIIGAGKSPEISKIKAHLSQRLPDYMMPTYFVEMEKFPLTAIGKIDRKALPKPKIGTQSFIPYITVDMLNRMVPAGERGKKTRTAAAPGPQTESPVEKLSEQEREKILFSFNATHTPYPSDKTLRELFEDQVEKRPDSLTLVFDDQQITYAHLNSRAERLGLRLRHKGVKSECIVGLMVERSIEWIMAILGILKAGGAYLPIGLEFPAERRKFILNDSRAKIILVNRMKTSEKLPELDFSAELMDINPPDRAEDQSKEEKPLEPVFNRSIDLVYMMYTSGTTGTPKGVMIDNRAVVNFIIGLTDVVDINESDTILSLSTVSFDMVVEETILTLMRGTKIIIGNPYQQSVPSAAGLVMQREKVTVFQTTPSTMRLYVSDKETLKALKGLRYLLVGGEALPQSLLEKMRACTNGKIYNPYGPTETTVWSTIKEVTTQPLNIGKPIANTRIYILDPADRVQPVGVAGELCIGGDGVARGYIGRPELTAETFTEDPFVKGERIYRTGDLASWLPDGDIEFIGRKDHQVQIRGLRIEPEEIESLLLTHEDINDAVIVVKEDDNEDKYLSAWIVSPKRLMEADLREYLSKELPHYMIPLAFVQLEEIPLLPTRKANRKLLEAIEIEKESQYEAPGDEVENRLAEIWAEVLGIDKILISMDADFFRLGGDSILGLQMVLKARQAGIGITSLQVFEFPILEKLAALAKSKKPGKPIPPVSTDVHVPLLQMDEKELEKLTANNPGIRDIYPLTPIQQQMLSYNLMTPDPVNTIMHLSWEMTGELDLIVFEKAWQTAARRHDMLRTAFSRGKLKEPLQLLYDSVTLPFQRLDCSHMSAQEQSRAVEDYLVHDKKQRFKMAKPPLMRLCLMTFNSRSYRLICSYSSLLFDNWSSTIIVKEVFHFYDSYMKGDQHQASLPGSLPFVDYVKWLYSHDQSEVKYSWTRELEGFDSPVDLNIQRLPGYADRTDFKPAEREIRFLPGQVHDLKALSNKYRLTLGTLLQGAWMITLSYLSEEEDILSGVISYGRPTDFTGIESMVGLFINAVPVRVKVPGHRDFITWLKEFQDKQARIRQFDYVTIADISKWSQVPLDKIQKAIYERTFVLVKIPGEEFFSGLSRDNPIKISRYDDSLILNVPLRIYVELSDGITIRLKYDGGCFAPAAIDQVADCLEKLLRNIMLNPGVSLGDLKSSKMMAEGNSGLKEV